MKKTILILMLLLNVSFTISRAEERPLAMTEAEAREFCAKWLPNWVGGAPAVENLLTFYTDDAFYDDPNVPKGAKGKEALGSDLKLLLAKYPDWKFDIVSINPTPKGFILQYLAKVPQIGGKTIENFRGVDIIEMEGGKISKQQGYFDRHVFFE